MVGPLSGKEDGFLRPGDDRDVFVIKFEVEKESPLKIKELYSALHDDLAAEGWVDPVSGDDKFENLYWEREGDNGWKEHHIWWRAVKYPHGDSALTRWALKIDFQTLMVRDTEIGYKGKKKKVDMGDFIVRFWFWVQFDPQDKFKNSAVKSLQQTFRRQLLKDELEQEKEDVKNYAYKIQKFVKTFLSMQDAGDKIETFHPEGGYKDPFAP